MTDPAQTSTPLQPGNAELRRLASLLQAYTPYDGAHELRLPGAFAVRASQTNAELFHTVYQPSLCIVAQGAKRLFLGPEIYDYDSSRMLMFSVELPVASQVTQASRAQPFVCLRLNLDPVRVAELALRVFPHGLPPVSGQRGVAVAPAPAGIVSAAVRLLALMADPHDTTLLAPLVTDEILIRLLRGPLGSRVAQLSVTGSNAQRVTRAVEWVRDHFAEPVNIDALAALVHMSPSSFHQHFKAVTSLSPLQFQKELRLREARRLMFGAALDASTASQRVGYLSASQFSREYARLFGAAPSKDMARLRQAGQRPATLN
jgi:AraC-like DNA-binding protein